MLRDQNLIAFVSVVDPARAKAFYQDTLGLKLTLEKLPYIMEFDANGRQLCVHVAGKLMQPVPYTVLGWVVGNIAAEIDGLTARGVVFERFPGMEQDARCIWTAPGEGTQVAWFKDPDGNLLSVTQVP